mmetsp:Transcript_2415/g.5712  ORF Transcript_2415/g.5712 Transcript_2415/m.5712 type:complete len:211 (+) Transcript_2415:177-809(+)
MHERECVYVRAGVRACGCGCGCVRVHVRACVRGPPPSHPLRHRQAQQFQRLFHNFSHRVAHNKAPQLLLAAQHLAVPVKLCKLGGQFVKVVSQEVHGEGVRAQVQCLLQTHEDAQQVLFGVVGERQLAGVGGKCGARLTHCLPRGLILPADGADAHIRVQEVHRCVPVQGQHLLVRELVVGRAVAAQVKIFDGAHAHSVRDGRHLRLAEG